MKNKSFVLVLSIGVAAIVVAILGRFVLPKSNNASIITSATLTEAIDISDLSTAEFTYRGIAEVYEDEEKNNISCHVFYSAVVKAGIDMKEVRFDIDSENKIITTTLPEISLKVSIVDEQSMAVIPSDKKVGLDVMLKYSKEDAEKEAKETNELMDTARINLESTIKGLLLPIIEPQGYSLIFN